jgi:hypothetical protein
VQTQIRLFSTFLFLFTLFTSAFTSASAATQSEEITALFPDLDDLPGGRNHWVTSVLPAAENDSFTTYSATYAYFAQEPTVLFDIPRKNIYSVNIRIHVCTGNDAAEKVFDRFSKVGTKEQKRFVGLGERGILYVVPNPKNRLMGDFYLTVKLKYLILQVHADDGFVLMDISEKMVKKLSDYLRLSKRDIANGLTLYITGTGIEGATQLVSFYSPNVSKIAFSGRLIDQDGANISGAKIKVLETGNEAKTGKNGEFSFNLGKGKGKTYSLYRFLTVQRNPDPKSAPPITSGFYKVDIAYTDKTGQDVWKIWIGENGKINGTSLNLSDSKRLNFTGTLKDGRLAVSRPCGNSFIGACRQDFTAALKGGVFEGSWKGSGGGGKWRLYKDSFSENSISMSLEEADYKVEGTKKSGLWQLGASTPLAMRLTQPKEDFYFTGAKLLVEATAATAFNGRIIVKGKNKSETADVTSSPYFPISKDSAGAQLPFTSAYLNPKYPLYTFELAGGKSAMIKPSLELTFASGRSKSHAKGLFTAKLIGSTSEKDFTSNTKIIKPNGKNDAAISISADIFGATLNAVSITAETKSGKREWNTKPGNFFPGIAVVDETGEYRNNPDGSIRYPFQKFSNRLILYFDKGAVEDLGNKITLRLNIDDNDIIMPIN